MNLVRLAAAALVAMSLSFSGGIAAASPVTPVTTTPTNSEFNDISQTGFVTEINWMRDRGITTGYPDGSFRPHGSVTRYEMAAFLYRMAGSPAYTASATSPFQDVHSATPFYKEILWMRDSRISTGWSDWTFRPNETVSREAMAAFMHRFAEKQCGVSTTARRSFTDTNTSPFADSIAWMGGAGISTGFSDGTYRPSLSTKRMDMAAFLYRLDKHLTVNGGCSPAPIEPLPDTMPYEVRKAAIATRVYDYVKQWCPESNVLVDHQHLTGTRMGLTWWGRPDLAIRSDLDEDTLKRVSLHECAHILQARAIPSRKAALVRMGEIYGAAGTNFGLEENADCISAYLNPYSQPAYIAEKYQTFLWKNRCYHGQMGEAAIKVIQGIHP